MEDFRAILPRLDQLKTNKAVWHREQLEDEKALTIKTDLKRSRQKFRWLIVSLLVVALLVGAAVSLGTILYANRIRQTQAMLQAQYDTSLACLTAEEYHCARDGFQALMASGADFPDLERNWNQAQFGLARQYYDSGQWENAVEELKTLLNNDPGNEAAVEMLKNSYDRWIVQLGLEGKFLKKWSVRRERDARFPPGDQ